MRVLRLAVLVMVLCALPHTAGAQDWAEAYGTGDYAKAARLLQPIAANLALSMGQTDDAGPIRSLSLLYSQGLGVERDAVVACAVAQLIRFVRVAAPASIEGVRAYEAVVRQHDEFFHQQCGSLSADEQQTALAALGCFAFGLREQTLVVGGKSVHVGRRGVFLAGTDPPGSLMDCPVLFARVRARAIEPPADAPPGVGTRHVVELYYWQIVGDPGEASKYGFRWLLYELRNEGLNPVAQTFMEMVDSWPDPAAPPDLDSRVTFEMVRSGNVRWRVAGTPPRRGWLPEVGEGSGR